MRSAGARPASRSGSTCDSATCAARRWTSASCSSPVPFRAYLHLASDEERLEALQAARGLLRPGGRLVFDVFAPSREDIEETDGRWLEREPGIFERADWDLERQTLTLSVRDADRASTMTLWWLEPARWQALLAEAGFELAACYGWFDRRPYRGGEDSVWIARRT